MLEYFVPRMWGGGSGGGGREEAGLRLLSPAPLPVLFPLHHGKCKLTSYAVFLLLSPPHQDRQDPPEL